MIPFKNRFHGHNSLTYTYKNGQTIRTKLFTLRFCTNPRKRFSRVAVVVSKKIAKKAVKRNFMRRRLYNIIHHYIDNFTQHYDLIIMVNSLDVMTIDFYELKQKLVDELQNTGIIANSQ